MLFPTPGRLRCHLACLLVSLAALPRAFAADFDVNVSATPGLTDQAIAEADAKSL
jgi:hypothetical protein